jgi:peroxiredoxin
MFPTASSAKKEIGLKVGSRAPQIMTKDIDGKSFNLNESVKKENVILVFYRGGWCPYCNTQLRTLQAQAVPKLKKANAKIVAISVDRVEEAIKTKTNEKLNMTIISDPSAGILKKYNIVNKVDEKLVKKYKDKYKLDLEKASGKKHHIIAIPAVFVVTKNRKISFAYANENYKVRAQIKDVLDNIENLNKTK